MKYKLGKLKYNLKLKVKLFMYSFSKDAKIIKSLKNKYNGERCFIVGNGPSLNVEDLEKLKNEKTFAANRIYHIFDKTEWRPTFYCSEDLKIIKNSINEINKLDIKFKFLPLILNIDYNIDINGATYFNLKYNKNKNTLPKFSQDILKYVGCGSTVTYTAIQIAAYMGFKEIYLIGIDHTFSVSKNNNGDIIIDNSVKDYFCEEYNSDKDKLDIPNTENSTLAYISAKKYADKHNIKIFNATRGGKLEVFERVDFDNIFIKENM